MDCRETGDGEERFIGRMEKRPKNYMEEGERKPKNRETGETTKHRETGETAKKIIERKEKNEEKQGR